MYHLLDHCNARNAAELARCASDPFCAMPCNTPGWVPPSERLIVNEHARGRIQFSSTTTRDKWHRNLGYGAVVWCGGIFETPLTAPGSPNEQWTRLQATKRNRNVCRPFDQIHMMRVAARHIGEEHQTTTHFYATAAERKKRISRKAFKFAIAVSEALGEEGIDSVEAERVTPPNHGHGAACGCCVIRIGVRSGARIAEMTAATVNCPNCKGSVVRST